MIDFCTHPGSPSSRVVPSPWVFWTNRFLQREQFHDILKNNEMLVGEQMFDEAMQSECLKTLLRHSDCIAWKGE